MSLDRLLFGRLGRFDLLGLLGGRNAAEKVADVMRKDVWVTEIFRLLLGVVDEG